MRRLAAILVGLTAAFAQAPSGTYTQDAKIAGLEGEVLLTGTRTEDGSLKDLKIERSLGLGLDEAAIAAMAGTKVPEPSRSASATDYAVDFTLPENGSRWHLVNVDFSTPEGATRPTFAETHYPRGAGITRHGAEEAQILAVTGKVAWAAITFDVGEDGLPGNFAVRNASYDSWGPEAIEVVRTWRFHPGMRGGVPVLVPVTVTLVWGATDFESIANRIDYGESTPPYTGYCLGGAGPLPEYSDEARRKGIEGTVEVSFEATDTGVVTDVRIEKALDPGLDSNALDALKRWKAPWVTAQDARRRGGGIFEVHYKLTGVSVAWRVEP